MKNKWIPTPLLDGSERRSLPIRPALPPGRGGVLLSLWQVIRFLGLLLVLRFRRISPHEKALIVREFLERRGGLWIKISQTLASRHDALPDVYCEELGKLFDSATAFPWEQAKQVIEESLGRPLEEVFSEFSERPIAAASIAQTHQARLRWNDALVAVKVRRPHIETIFRRDLKLVGFLARLLEKIPRFRHLHPLDMHGELEVMLLEELDFRVEATLIRDMRKKLRKQRVFAPRAHFRFCTRDVLVMSFVQGVLMADYLRVAAEDPLRATAWLDENRIDPEKLARRLYFSGQRQVFEENFFHGDLHPGNIMLLRRSRFALLDFGAVGSLDLNTRKQVMLYHRLVAEGDLSRALMVLIHMSSPVPRIDVAALLRRLVRVTQKSLRFMTVRGLPYEERIYSDATNQQLRIMGQARIPVSWDFLRAQRTFTVLEMSLRQLDPKIEPMKLSRAYFEKRRERLEEAAGGERRQLFDNLQSIADDARFLLKELSDARSLAGRLFDRDLSGEAAHFIRSMAGLFMQGIAVTVLVILTFWGLQHHSWVFPDWLRSALAPMARIVPRLEEIAWFGLVLLAIWLYRFARAVRRSYG